jgi:type IV fimbrial biogenesis protein FimT
MMYQKGFTLIELMVAITIATLLLTVGVPSFSSTLLRMESSAISDQLVSSIYFSRNEAISRNQRVTLCASTNGLACDISNVNTWNSGWIATLQDASNNTVVIRYWTVNNQNSQITLASTTLPDSIIFTAQGDIFLNSKASAAIGQYVSFSTQSSNCSSTDKERRNIAIAPFGTVTIAKVSCL